MNRNNFTTASTSRQPSSIAFPLIELTRIGFGDSESTPVYVNPADVSLIEPSSLGAHIYLRKRGVPPFYVEQTPEEILQLMRADQSARVREA